VSIDDTGWLEPTYAAGISGNIRMRRKEGVTTIWGTVFAPNLTNGGVMFTLPAGFYAPTTYFRFPAQMQFGGICQLVVSGLQYSIYRNHEAGQHIYINLSFLSS